MTFTLHSYFEKFSSFTFFQKFRYLASQVIFTRFLDFVNQLYFETALFNTYLDQISQLPMIKIANFAGISV